MELAALPTSVWAWNYVLQTHRAQGKYSASRKGTRALLEGPASGACVQGTWISRPVWGGLREFFFIFFFLLRLWVCVGLGLGHENGSGLMCMVELKLNCARLVVHRVDM